MRHDIARRPSLAAAIVFDLLNPVPYGFFVGALVFDVVYANSPDLMWVKCAAWLISLGLVVAIAPRLINLVQVWRPGAGRYTAPSKAAFVLHLAGIAAAIANAFVHSRDAYAAVPDGVWLSAITVALMSAGNIFVTLHQVRHDQEAPQ